MTSLKRVLRPKIQVNGKDMNDVYDTGDNSKIFLELFYILDVFTTNISDSVKKISMLFSGLGNQH